MKIMPVSGNDIGFAIKGWSLVKSSLLKTQQTETGTNDDEYFNSMAALTVKEFKISDVESQEETDVVRSPGSSWGGREIVEGYSYSTSADVVLEGDVVLPYSLTDEEAKKEIGQDFSDWGWSSNNGCFDIVEKLQASVKNDPREKTSATVQSISKNQNGTYHVIIDFHIDVTGYESSSDVKDREDSERADRNMDSRRDREMDNF